MSLRHVLRCEWYNHSPTSSCKASLPPEEQAELDDDPDADVDPDADENGLADSEDDDLAGRRKLGLGTPFFFH